MSPTIAWWKPRIELLFYCISVVALIVGVFIAAFEYLGYIESRESEENNKKTERSFSYVNMYFEKGFWEADRTVTVKLEEITKKAMLDQQANPDKWIYLSHYEAMVNYIKINRWIEGELDYLLFFYDYVRQCEEMGLCEKQVLREYLSKDANKMFRTWAPYICEKREEGRPDFWLKSQNHYVPVPGDYCEPSSLFFIRGV
jgi:hypothetical protein